MAHYTDNAIFSVRETFRIMINVVFDHYLGIFPFVKINEYLFSIIQVLLLY